MILGLNGTYRAYGVAKAGAWWIPTFREFSKHSGGNLTILPGQTRDREKALRSVELTTAALARAGWDIIPLSVLRSTVGMSDTFDPYAGFAPLPSVSGKQAEAIRAADAVKIAARKKKEAAELEAQAKEAEARKIKAEIEAKEAHERRVAQLAATDVPERAGAMGVIAPTSVQDALYRNRVVTPALGQSGGRGGYGRRTEADERAKAESDARDRAVIEAKKEADRIAKEKADREEAEGRAKHGDNWETVKEVAKRFSTLELD